MDTMPMPTDIFEIPVPPEPEPALPSPKRNEILSLPTLILGEDLPAEEALEKLPGKPEGDGESGLSNGDIEEPGVASMDGYEGTETVITEPVKGDDPNAFDAMKFQDITRLFFSWQDIQRVTVYCISNVISNVLAERFTWIKTHCI